jgi:hypothetical protein
MPPTTRALRRTLALLLTAPLVACSTSSPPPGPPCVSGLTPECAATYSPPAFAMIFTGILQPNCAVGTGTCHTPDFDAGGLVFADQTRAYDLLVAPDGGTAYVTPGDPGCSTLMKRLESTDPSYHMPRGPNFLSSGDLCTIVQWISQGASP